MAGESPDTVQRKIDGGAQFDLSPAHTVCSKAGVLSRDFTQWQALMAAARAGDEVAYNTLLREIARWLNRYYRLRLNPSAAEDAAQEVLLVLHRRRETLEPSVLIGPWIVQVARYKRLDRLRQQFRDRNPPPPMEIVGPDHGAATRSKILIEAMLDRLKPSQARVIRLCKLYGASVEEASRATGQSMALVKVNIHRGLKHMALALNGQPAAL